MEKQLSLIEAKRLSIIKWELIVQNNGLYHFIKWPPEIEKLNCHCGFCERWAFPYEDSCGQCELALKMGRRCTSELSPYITWLQTPTKETAQVMLDIIKNL